MIRGETPGTNRDLSTQRVSAFLLDENEARTDQHVLFTGQLSLASEVQYDPGCPSLQQALGGNQHNVQDALDALCGLLEAGAGGGVSPAPNIALRWFDTASAANRLGPGTLVPLASFAGVSFDIGRPLTRPVSPEDLRLAVRVAAEVAVSARLGPAVILGSRSAIVAYADTVLGGTLRIDTTGAGSWTLADATRTWLTSTAFGNENRLLLRLVVDTGQLPVAEAPQRVETAFWLTR